MFSHILVPLDESRLAEHVLPHVTALAPLDGARVTLLNVLEPPSTAVVAQQAEPVEWQLGMRRAQSYLEAVKERLERHGVQAAVELIEGDPTTSILEFVKRNGVDLIALTSHGAGGEERHCLGQVALRTLLGAKISVLLVRSFNPVFATLPRSGTADVVASYSRVLVPLDGSLRAEAALPYAERLCHTAGGCLHAVTVVRPTSQWADEGDGGDAQHRRAAHKATLDRARGYLDGVSRAASAPHRLLKTAVIDDADVVGSIDSLAISEESELLVMSAHGASGGTRTPYGAATLDLLIYGYAPLLVVQDRSPRDLRESHAERASRERQGHG
ncbi:MAG TPA: universal stress protein [Trueperaceae bacterium]|nr:universal stress protein [Trueperaceae bacterium]